MGSDLQSPAEVAELLTNHSAPHFKRHHMEFKVHYVGHVRDIRGMLPTVLKFEGCYGSRDGKEAPHSFSFAPRSWLQRSIQDTIETHPRFQNPHDDGDIVCLVKQWMADETLAQPPILVYLAAMRQIAAQFVRSLNQPMFLARRSPPERKADLIRLADCLESKYQLLYERAVTYIRILANGGPQETPQVNRLYFVMHPRSLMLLRPAVGNVELDVNFIPHRLKIVVANQ